MVCDMTKSIYKQCPILEAKNFIFRLVALSDAEDLLACYANPQAQAFFNTDNFPHNCAFNTVEEMAAYIRFWLVEYSQQAYVRFAIVSKQLQKAVGTIEMFGMVGKYKTDPGILRIDIAPAFECQVHLAEILDVCVKNFYDMFGVSTIVTKAVPQAVDRIAALESAGFRTCEYNGREHYYARQKGCEFANEKP